MTVLDFLTLTRRSWKTLTIFILAGVLAGLAYGLLTPKVYESSASGYVATEGSAVFLGTDAAANKAASYLPLITSKKVLDRISASSGVPESALNGSLSASMAGGTLIQVTATAADPRTALTLANGALAALAAVIQEIESRVTSSGSESIKVVPLENAVEPSAPSSPNTKLAMLEGAAAGLVLGYAFVFLRRAVDVRVRKATDLATLSGGGVLGRIPKLGARHDSDTLLALAGESLRQIRTGLRFASVDKPVRSLAVTSANQGEGKSTIAASLGRVVAEGDQPTIVVDADLRRPTVASQFDVDGSVGLSEVLSGQIPLVDAIRRTGDSRLLVLPAGGIPPNPSEMLGSDALRSLIDLLSQEYFVIVDAPPVLPVTDALLVSDAVDGVVFIGSAGRTRKADISAARADLERAHARILGVILNMVPPRDSQDGYAYYRQYRSSYGPQRSRKSKRSRSEKTKAQGTAVPQAPASTRRAQA